MDANKKFWQEFLEMYRGFPCLWNVKCPDYSKRMAKNNAYKILAEKFKEIYPDANKQLVLRKINIMRTCYRREARKVKESEIAGAAGKEVYVPNLWYFNLLTFLEDQDKEGSGDKNVHEFHMSNESCTGDDKKKFVQELFSYPQRNIKREASKVQKSNRLQDEIIRPQRKPKQEQQQKERVPEVVKRQPSNKPQQPMPKLTTAPVGGRTDDETAALSSTWGILYRDLDPRQKLFANKAINEVLYQGALGKLHAYSYKAIEEDQQIATENIWA